MFFSSDNSAPVPQPVMDALQAANQGHAKSYGADDLYETVRQKLRDFFDAPDADVHLVTSGTAANVLALACHCPPWGAIFCHEEAHIHVDECGAPEFYTNGAKLVPMSGDHGKMDAGLLAQTLAKMHDAGVHAVQPAMLSLTNITEAGTIYSPTETRALTDSAKQYGLACHLDGARFCNALAASGATPADLSWRAGIDVLSFGGTKNGLMGVEAVIFFTPQKTREKAWEFELRRKRAGHLMSKSRYLAAQMLAMLEHDHWHQWAHHANQMAQRLAQGLVQRGVHMLHPVEANMLFVEWPAGMSDRLRQKGATFYNMPCPSPHERARLVTGWQTGADDVDRFLALF